VQHDAAIHCGTCELRAPHPCTMHEQLSLRGCCSAAAVLMQSCALKREEGCHQQRCCTCRKLPTQLTMPAGSQKAPEQCQPAHAATSDTQSSQTTLCSTNTSPRGNSQTGAFDTALGKAISHTAGVAARLRQGKLMQRRNSCLTLADAWRIMTTTVH
jgi:hypothetical protein